MTIPKRTVTTVLLILLVAIHALTAQKTPIRSEQTPIQSEQTPIQSEQTPIQSWQTAIQSEQTPIQSWQTAIQSEKTPIQSLSNPINWNGQNWAMQCDFKDGSFKTLPMKGEKCRSACFDEPTCTHFAWTELNGGTCRLMTGGASKSDARPVTDPAAVCGVLGDASPTPSSAPINWNGQNWAKRCDFRDGSFKTLPMEGEKCGSACAAEPMCTHFAWTELNGGTCRLMTGGASKSDARPVTDPAAVCGVLGDASSTPSSAKIEWNGQNWARRCDFFGEGFESRQIRGEECVSACFTEPRCTHFKWTQLDGGTCMLMSGKVTKDDAIPVLDPNAICGVKSGEPHQPLNWTNENWARGCYFQEGKELMGSRSSSDSADKCRLACLDDLECTHFVWKDMTCRLMGGRATKEDATPTADPNIICGVITCLASSLKSLGVAWSLVAATVVFYIVNNCLWLN